MASFYPNENIEEGVRSDEQLLGDGQIDGECDAGKAQQMTNADKFVIVVAGKPRCGKSRALNNIFRVASFDSRSSASSVTRTMSHLRVLKDNQELIVVDTPGLGAVDIPRHTFTKEFQKIIGGLDYTLLLCHSVGPNNMLTEMDLRMLKDLQKISGIHVWKRCVILFTFSDALREQMSNQVSDRDSYVQVLRTHAMELSQTLRRVCGNHVPLVKTIFDVDMQSEHLEEIVAVPVGFTYKDKKEKHNILPDDVNGKDWRDRAYKEILRRSKSVNQVKMPTSTSVAAAVSSGSVAGVVGALMGGFTGSVVGILTGGVAIIPGAVIGAVVGGFAGMLGGAGSGSALVMNDTHVVKKKLKLLSEGDVHVIPPDQQVLPQESFQSPLSAPRLQIDDRSSQLELDSLKEGWPSRTYPTNSPRFSQDTSDGASSPYPSPESYRYTGEEPYN